MSACSVSSVDLRPVQIYNRARSTCEVAGRLTWVEMFSVGAGTNWSAHSDFQHAQANAIWLGLEFRIKLFIKAQVSVGASICSAELTTVIVAVISSSSNYSLERQMRLLLFPAEDFSPWWRLYVLWSLQCCIVWMNEQSPWEKTQSNYTFGHDWGLYYK